MKRKPLLHVAQFSFVEDPQQRCKREMSLCNQIKQEACFDLAAGYFSLNVPSGLTLYWFNNNLLTTGQQVSSLACEQMQAGFSTLPPLLALVYTLM